MSSFKEFGRVVEESKNQSFPEFGKIVEEIPRWKSLLNAPTKEELQQIPIGFAEGALGSYGNLAEAFHANPKESLTENQKLKGVQESEKPAEELIYTTSDELAPEGTGRLPTSQDVDAFLKMLNLAPEPQSRKGKVAKATAKGAGAVSSFAANPTQILLAAAGSGSGEQIRESGGPEWLANMVDIGINLADIIKKAPAAIAKKISKKPSGLSVRKFEGIEKPTKVTPGTKKSAIESVEKEFKNISEKIQDSTNKSLSSYRADPSFQSAVGEGYEKLKWYGKSINEKAPGKVYQDFLRKESDNIGSKGFEFSDIEKSIKKDLEKGIASAESKELSFNDLLDQFQKNNKEKSKYLPYGPNAVENEVKIASLNARNKAIEKTMESQFSHEPVYNKFKFLNEKWHEVEKIKTVDKFVESIFPGDKIDYNKARKALEVGKRSRNLEAALGKEGFKEFKQLTSDLLYQEKGMKLLKDHGYTLEDIGKTGSALLFKPGLAKTKIATQYITQIWRRGLADPVFRREWSNAVSLMNKGRVDEAVSIIQKLSKEKED